MENVFRNFLAQDKSNAVLALKNIKKVGLLFFVSFQNFTKK